MKAVQLVRRVAWQLWLPVVLVALWWVVSAGSTDFYFPPLADIVDSFRENWLFDKVGSDLVPSMRRLFFGYLGALALGIVAGLLLGVSKGLATALNPVLEFLRALPSVAVIPIMVLFFGLDEEMKIATLAFVGFFPIMLNTMDGARSVDTQLRDVARSYHVSFKDRMLSIYFPAAAPQVFAGARIALSLSIMALALAEMIGTPGGIGHNVLAAQRAYNTPAMWAGILLFGVIGYVLNWLFLRVENTVLSWHRGMTAVGR